MFIFRQKIIFILFSIFSVFVTSANAATFFASNNTKEISLQTAYKRLTGAAQKNLHNTVAIVLQKNHVAQATSIDVLGTYQMSTDKNITADNTQRVTTLPKQKLSDEKIIALARVLAMQLKQDSVAVFIPEQAHGRDIIVHLIHPTPIHSVVDMLHHKLPPLYNQAFSLHLVNQHNNFDHAKVASIEWLGSKINSAVIRAAFASDKIDAQRGRTLLVYQNGKQEKL